MVKMAVCLKNHLGSKRVRFNIINKSGFLGLLVTAGVNNSTLAAIITDDVAAST